MNTPVSAFQFAPRNGATIPKGTARIITETAMESQATKVKAGKASAMARYACGGRPSGPIAHLSCEQRAAQRLREFARVRRMATSAALGVVINGYLDSLERDGEPRGATSRGN